MTRPLKAALVFFFLCGAAIFVTDHIRHRRHAASGVQQEFTVPQLKR
jgi:hypothetical protein